MATTTSIQLQKPFMAVPGKIPDFVYDTTGALVGAVTPDGQMRLFGNGPLAQSAVPVILAPNGTVAADGTITLGTALPAIYAAAWVRLPAGAVVGGLAGLYFATFSSTTVGSIKTNFVDAATAFTPYIPTGTVAAVGSGSAYTQTTAADITLANITVPGGLMGANGALRTVGILSTNNGTGIKTSKVKLATALFRSLSMSATAVSGGQVARIINRGTQSAQVGHDAFDTGTEGAYNSNVAVFGSINTALDQPLTFTGQLAVATDYIVLEGFTVEVLPG